MKNFGFMLGIFFFNDPADEGSVSQENKRNYNGYGNNYKDQQANI